MINEVLSSAISMSIIFGGGGRLPSYSEEYHHTIFNIDTALVDITTDYYDAYYSVPVPTLVPVRDIPTVTNEIKYLGVGTVIEELHISDTYYEWAFYQDIQDIDHYGTTYSIDLISSTSMFYNWETDPDDLTFALIGNGTIYDCNVHITANARGVEIGTNDIEYTTTPISYTFSASTTPEPLFPLEFKRLLDSAPNSTNTWELMDFKCHVELSSDSVINDRIGLLINQTHSETNYNNLNLEELYLKPYSSFTPTIPQVNFSDFLISAVGGFLDTELWPGFSLGGMLAICVSLGVFTLILKMFAGG